MKIRPLVTHFSIVLFLGVLSGMRLAPAVGSQVSSATAAEAFTVDDLLDIVNVSMADLSEDGRWLAATGVSLRDRIGIDNSRFGDPTYVAPSKVEVWIIDTQSARKQQLFPDKRGVRGLRWSPDGTRLALSVQKGENFQPMIWERATGRIQSVALPAGHSAQEGTTFQWSPDGSQLYFFCRTDEQREKLRERFIAETKGPIVTHSSKEPFLAWEDLRRGSLLRSLLAFNIRAGQSRQVLPETKLNSFDVTEDGSSLTYHEDITKKTDYEVIGGSENQVQVMPIGGGSARIAIKSTKGLTLIWARDGRHYAYAKDGNLFFGAIDGSEAKQLTGTKQESSVKAETKDGAGKDDSVKDTEKKKEKERFVPVRLSASGDRLIASTKEGLWVIETGTASKELFLKMPEEDKESPRYQVLEWSPDSKRVYLSYVSRTAWERGVARYDFDVKRIEDLFKDGHLYSGYRISKDGRTLLFARADGNRPADLYAADIDGKNLRRLTDANPKLQSKRLSRTELIPYYDADGNKSYGVLYYPVDYERGKKYPTIFNIYEQFFDDSFSATINILASHGYAVMQPSVNLEIGFPGEAWVKGVTTAANKLIEMGIADPERMAVQGTSYGGYATNLLITQTNRFKAAINISGKVNMVSFYTDSPRLGVRNIHAPEKSQDRLGATLWQQPQKYIQHSAIMFADRIKTPLLLMTGEQDHNVPARQAMEMYYALRRLGKEVEWVSYVNGGHGMPTSTEEEVRDYHKRIVDWYDSHLKGDLKKTTDEPTNDNR